LAFSGKQRCDDEHSHPVDHVIMTVGDAGLLQVKKYSNSSKSDIIYNKAELNLSYFLITERSVIRVECI
jgi:hypothetical protein